MEHKSFLERFIHTQERCRELPIEKIEEYFFGKANDNILPYRKKKGGETK